MICTVYRGGHSARPGATQPSDTINSDVWSALRLPVTSRVIVVAGCRQVVAWTRRPSRVCATARPIQMGHTIANRDFDSDGSVGLGDLIIVRDISLTQRNGIAIAPCLIAPQTPTPQQAF